MLAAPWNRALIAAAVFMLCSVTGRANLSLREQRQLFGAFPTDAESLLQESVQIVAREAELAAASAAETTPSPGAKRQFCNEFCTGEYAQGIEKEPSRVENAEASTTDDTGEQFCFFWRFARPYRLRAVGIAVVGFGLLRLDVAPAMLLAV
mmetsp:Transcript_117105/g.343040  ORF Transcript_117105/g.343040 Transcript_117105/m.343040 type:complete len:151 (-) Transcript_117105:22-474(-)